MFGRSSHPAGSARPEGLRFSDPAVPSRSCCCPARPVVKVIMPPGGADRAHSVDLWLCGHHYRASLTALAAAGATVEDLTGMATERPQADRTGLIPA